MLTQAQIASYRHIIIVMVASEIMDHFKGVTSWALRIIYITCIMMFSNLHTLDCESVELHFFGPRLLSRETRLPLLRAFLVACAPHPNLDLTISSFPNGRRQIWFQVVGGKDTLKMSYKVSSMPTFPKHSGIFWFCGSPWAAGLAFQKSAFSPLFNPV